jgi:hypothetical protein
MFKLIAALVLSLSSIVAVVVVAPPSIWGGGPGGPKGGSFKAPEIDPASAVSALTLLLGGMAVLRSRTAAGARVSVKR